MNDTEPTEASQHLLALARQNAEIYKTLPTLRALIVTGSAVEGTSDYYSDIDMIAYYDTLPSEEMLSAAAMHNGGKNRRQLAPRSDMQAMEAYEVRGVECQVAHTTVIEWERDMATVLEQFEVATPLQKALSGLLECEALYGEELIRQWQDRISDYSDAFAKAMVEHYLVFFPLWGLRDRLESRDAMVWIHEVLVQTSQNLLGVTAGLNRLYYSPFQFKKMRRFIDKMTIKPPDFADRINSLFSADVVKSAVQSEMLVQDVLNLVEYHMPEVDTTRVRQRIGWRHKPWSPPLIDA